MKRSDASRMWTDPTLPIEADFHHISFALFRVDTDIGRVVAARCPDRGIFRLGDYLQDRLRISEEAFTYAVQTSVVPAPLFMMTDKGLGILSKRYDLQAGVGLFCHIHCHPEAGARLINNRVLGIENGHNYCRSQAVRALGDAVTKRDAVSYAALMDAWQAVSEAPELFEPDGDGNIRLPALQEGIRKLAAFVGCDVTFVLRKLQEGDAADAFPRGRVSCPRPRLLEAMLLVLLSEVREYSATRGCVCRLESSEETTEGSMGSGHKPLRMTLRYPVEGLVSAREQTILAAVYSHTAHVGGLSGLDVYRVPNPVPSRRADGLLEQIIALDWVADPTLLSTSDLKSRILLEYGADADRGVPSDAEEIPIP